MFCMTYFSGKQKRVVTFTWTGRDEDHYKQRILVFKNDAYGRQLHVASPLFATIWLVYLSVSKNAAKSSSTKNGEINIYPYN
jgi:hypothetical protein